MQSRIQLSNIALSVLVFSAFAFYLVSPWTSSDTSTAARDVDSAFQAPRANPWVELSPPEIEYVYDFLQDEHPELNITRTPRTGRENHVNFMELLRPNKTDATTYLSGKAALPLRWAKAAITLAEDEEVYLCYYMIGPLSPSSETTLTPLTWPLNSGRHCVKNPVPSFARFQEFGMDIAANISDITRELLDAEGNPDDLDEPNSLLAMARPTWIENGTIDYWMGFRRPGAKSSSWSLLPEGLYVKLRTKSKSGDEWGTYEWYYNGIFYDSPEQLRKAMREPGFLRAEPNYDGSWTEIEDFDTQSHGRSLAPPVMVQPHGPRYQLDRKQQYVSWMGFSFYIASAQNTGPALFDIKFNGDSIMYELGLQEAMAHYAGDDPIQGGLEWMDTLFGMGKFAFELVPGYDCPAYADYLPLSYHISQKTWTNPGSICIFEYTADHALQRHTSKYHVSISRNQFLVLRSVSTVGNYDYTIDYIFYLDGTIEVKVRASGFIFNAFYSATSGGSEERYGYRIHDAAVTSMHDHVINFKADLDIAGPSNDFVRVAVEPLQRSYPWEQPEVPVRNTMVLSEHPVTSETGLNWPANSAEMYTVYHANKTNKWGERRGYRITPGTGMGTPSHLTIENSTTMGASGRWAEKDIWVVRNKVTEPRSADPLNLLEPRDPLIDFAKIANGETLNRTEDAEYDGDLVVYFNLGGHHVPHSGDIPNTLMHTSASSVMFVPFNFHDRDPSRSVVQGVRLDLKGGNGDPMVAAESESDVRTGDLRNRAMREENEGNKVGARKAEVNYFGTNYEKGVSLEKEQLEPDLSGYDSAENAIADLGFDQTLLGFWAGNGNGRV